MTLLIEALLALIVYIILSEVFNQAPPAPAQVSATLLANPNSIHPGESSLLTWTSKNAISAKLDTIVVPLQGSRTVSPTATTTYTLVVDGPGGPLAEVEVISVTPVPPPPPPPPPPPAAVTATITAAPSSIQAGQHSVITWATQNAVSASILGVGVALQGSGQVSPTTTSVYSLEAVGADGSKATASATVTVVPPPPAGIHLTLINQASQVNAADVKAYLAAQNSQLQNEFKAAWSLDYFIDEQPGGWPVTLLNVSDVPGALGYHDVDGKGSPYAKVFVQTSLNSNIAWQTVASHEVLEMAVDPGPIFKVLADSQGGLWDVEIGDPVEDIQYIVLGVPLSEFATPKWYVSGSPDTWDMTQKALTHDHGITTGGYATKDGQPVIGPSYQLYRRGSGFKSGVDIEYVRTDRRPKPGP